MQIFGPILAVHVYPDGDFSKILQVCDATSDYALTGSIFGRDRYALSQATDALEYAVVFCFFFLILFFVFCFSLFDSCFVAWFLPLGTDMPRATSISTTSPPALWSASRFDTASRVEKKRDLRWKHCLFRLQPFGGARASGTNDKSGSALNLQRWVQPRTIKETFVPPTNFSYPYMDE